MSVLLLIAAVIIIIITILFTLKIPSAITQTELQQEIQSIQQQLPVRIDPYTELENVETGKMQIKYSFLITGDQTALSGGLSIKDDNFAQQIETAVKSSVCINKQTKRYIDSEVSLAYRYVNKDNIPVADFAIPAGYCK